MNSIRKKEEARVRRAEPEIPGWWAAVPEGEKTLLHAVARMLRGAKRSQLAEVARAAAKWERGIGCFIKVRLMHERSYRTGSFRTGHKRRLIDSGWVRIEGRSEKVKDERNATNGSAAT